jgi:hypothetical protein
MYPDADFVHVGEIGDATDRLIEILDGLAAGRRGPSRFSPPRTASRSISSRCRLTS